MVLDLSLPDRAPELGQYGNYNWDDAAFAVYTLLGDRVPLQDVVQALEKQWLEQGNENHLVRPTPHVASLEAVRDIVKAHIDLDKGKRDRRDGGAAGDLEWWPTAFIVVVHEDWRVVPGGLLLVYADDKKDCELHEFFFRVEDAYMMLSSLSFGDEDLATSQVIYSQIPRK